MNDAFTPITQTFPRLQAFAVGVQHLLAELRSIRLDESSSNGEIADGVVRLAQHLGEITGMIDLLERRGTIDDTASALVDLAFVARLSLPSHERELAHLDGSDRWRSLLAVSRITEEVSGLLLAMEVALVRAGHLAESEAGAHDDANHDEGRTHEHLAELLRVVLENGEPTKDQVAMRLRRVGFALTVLMSTPTHGLHLEQLHTLRSLHASLLNGLRGSDARQQLDLWADTRATLELLAGMSIRHARSGRSEPVSAANEHEHRYAS